MITKKKDAKEYLSKEVTFCLKGYLCLCVLLHHMYLFTGFFAHTYFGHFLNRLGGWAVAVFFFISGYGVFQSYLRDGRQYVKSFMKKRVLPLYLTYLFFVFIYAVTSYATLSWRAVVASLSYGGTIVSFGWYFQEIFVFYLMFYVSFRFVERKEAGFFIYALLSCGYLIFSFYLGGHYLSVFPFTFGILIALYKRDVDRIMENHSIAISVVSFLSFFAVYLTYVVSFIMGKFQILPILWDVACVFSEWAIITFVISFSYQCCKKGGVLLLVNPVSKWLGKYSLEIYACQGLILCGLYPYLGSTVWFLIAGSLLTVLLAVLFHKGFSICRRAFAKIAS